MQIRKATSDDIELLVKLRIDFMLTENSAEDLGDIEVFKKKLADYYDKWLPSDRFSAFIAEEDGEVCSTAFISISERPPSKADRSNLVGIIHNVHTYPEFRRRGIATRVMTALLEDAENLGVAYVDLLATKYGKPLYEKTGFTSPSYTAMRKMLQHVQKGT